LAGSILTPLVWADEIREYPTYYLYPTPPLGDLRDFAVNPGPLVVGTTLAAAPATSNLHVRGRGDTGRAHFTFQGRDDGLSILSFILGADTGAAGTPDIRVGIGTTSPNEQLEITGNLRLPVTTATTGIVRSGPDRFLHRFGTNNFFAGVNAGNLTLSGADRNTGIGTRALSTLTSSDDNTAVGRNALAAIASGGSNTAVGSNALAITTSSIHTAIGFGTGRSNTTGSNNVAVGSLALSSNTTGSPNTAVGSNALSAGSFSASCLAVGFNALRSNTTGNGNTAFGSSALSSNTSGSANTAFGRSALFSNTIASNNTAAGAEALFSNTTAGHNTAVGFRTLRSNTTGANNTAVGVSALFANTIGSSNTAVGVSALAANTTGSNNTAAGWKALASNTTVGNNTAVGAQALAANTTGSDNNAAGWNALVSNTTGEENTAVGAEALSANTTGSFNTAVGRRAGVTETSANANTTGSRNTFIGYEAGPGTSTQLTNAAAIGYRAKVSRDNAMVLGATGPNAVNVGIATESPAFLLDVAGEAHATSFPVCPSDLRFKERIVPLTGVLPRLTKLQAVSFQWNRRYRRMGRATPGRSIGLVAQEVEKEFPELVSRWQDGSDYRALDYGRLSAVLLEGLKELDQGLKILRLENQQLKEELLLLEEELDSTSFKE